MVIFKFSLPLFIALILRPFFYYRCESNEEATNLRYPKSVWYLLDSLPMVYLCVSLHNVVSLWATGMFCWPIYCPHIFLRIIWSQCKLSEKFLELLFIFIWPSKSRTNMLMVPWYLLSAACSVVESDQIIMRRNSPCPKSTLPLWPVNITYIADLCAHPLTHHSTKW